MKALVLLFLIMSAFKVSGQSHPKVFSIPFTWVDGYGPFYTGFSPLDNEYRDNPERERQWGKTRLVVKGKPKHWTNVEKAMVWLDSRQLVYQNFLAGNISPTMYNDLQTSWKWTPNETRLSKKPIKCYFYTLRGFDQKQGKWAVMIDTNNNLDFSDETAFYPEAIDNKAPETYRNAHLVHYEIYQKGKVVAMRLPVVIKTMGSEFIYNFPQHAKATLKRDGKAYNLVMRSGGFTRPDFESIDLAETPYWFWQKKIGPGQFIELGEVITLGGVKYRNKGVDIYNNVLQLEEVDPTVKEYSLQVGYPFRPITAKEFSTGKPISLANYKGKYVYIDFWATWCRGCVQDIPQLRKLYAGLDKNRFEFIGISNDSPERLSGFIKKQNMQWPQLLSDNQSKLFEAYGVAGLPVTVLLDPNGRVIAKNLRGEGLATKLNELARQK